MNQSQSVRPKVLVTHRKAPAAGLKLLADSCDLLFCEEPLETRSEIIDKIKGVDGVLWVCHTTPLDAEILDSAGPRLKALSTLSSGVDYVDVGEFKRRSIQLGHTPAVLNETVADLVVGLMIAAGQGFRERRLALVKGISPSLRPREIPGSSVGIIGFGGVGQAVAKRLQGFEVAHFFYTGRSVKAETCKWNAQFVPLEELLQNSDFVILTCPLTDETKLMMNRSRFKLMKPTSVFVNVARGKCVDQDALYEALKNGVISAAGIDAMYPEPLPADHRLLGLPNLIITPHLGTATVRTREEMCVLAANNVLRALQGETMLSPVPRMRALIRRFTYLLSVMTRQQCIFSDLDGI